jgi:hypothetical protein
VNVTFNNVTLSAEKLASDPPASLLTKLKADPDYASQPYTLSLSANSQSLVATWKTAGAVTASILASLQTSTSTTTDYTSTVSTPAVSGLGYSDGR